MGTKIEILSKKCSFSWEKLREMKDNQIEFLAGDGSNLLRIIEIDEKQRSIYLINRIGRMSWPLKYQKLQEVHNKIHGGEIGLVPYEIDKIIPTWGSYITGLLKYLGCDNT